MNQDSKEAAFLLQQASALVARGCTTLQQPTDTHLAKPGKDGGRNIEDARREQMRLAALQLKKPAVYSSTKREILLCALAVQDAMLDLNRMTEVVLQAAGACGWLAYRPDPQGRTLPADRELWAQVHGQVAGKITAEKLAGRYVGWMKTASLLGRSPKPAAGS